MKTQTQQALTTLGKEHLNWLTMIVKETLAFEVMPVKTKVFTAAELWKIQGQKKAVRGRRGIM